MVVFNCGINNSKFGEYYLDNDVCLFVSYRGCVHGTVHTIV